MRKTIIPSNESALTDERLSGRQKWLDLTRIAHVEMSSEDTEYPVESAFAISNPVDGKRERGWRAAVSGPQTLSLRFDQPQGVTRVLLHFREAEQERSQEFSLHATLSDGRKQEIVRQQWSFSPGGSIDEQENYRVNLQDVITLTLWIDPDRGQNRFPATLQAFRVES